MRTKRLLAFAAMAAASGGIAACSGGSGSGAAPPVASPSPSPILIPGTTAHYTGTDQIVHAYASPSATQANYTESYTFALTTTVNTASSGAPAAFDINSALTYTTTQAPTTGTQKGTAMSDTFENQIASGANLTVSVAGAKSVTTGTDIAAGNAGGGPYTTTTTTTTTDTTPFTNGVYPLVAGAVYTEPFAKTVNSSTTDVNAGNQMPTTVFTTGYTETIANDSSYTRNTTLSNGEQETLTELSSGTFTNNETGPIFAYQETIGTPTSGASGYAIPVTELKQNVTTGPTPAPSATPATYNAADWYPGSALPTQPLATETVTVKGPAATLPSGCAGAISEPKVVELDLSLASLSVSGTYQTETQQRFDSNGVNVCVLRTVTTQNYTVTTGLLSETSTETYAQVLTSLTTGSGTASVRRKGT